MTTKHKGLHLHRLTTAAGNPREVAFANAWIEEHEYQNVLGYLMSKDNRAIPVADGTALAAATVIQWLGSPVGMSFLGRVIKNCPEVKEWLQAEMKEALLAK
jgi:hypothetical protein